MTYYNAHVGATGANQPLSYNPQAVASSSGGATFNFPAVPNGQTWTGTVTVIGAPDSASMTISSVHVGNDIGQFIGGNNWGPLQLQSGDQLIVTATGLTANTGYVCNFQGTAITGGDPGITYPEAYAHTVTIRSQTTQLANSSSAMSASGTTSLSVKVPVNPNYRSLYVIVLTAGSQISVAPTNFQWQVSATTDTAQGINGYPTPYGFGSSISTAPPIGSREITSNVAMYRFPIVSGMANNFVTFTISATYSNTPTTVIEYVIGADVENTDVAVFPTSQIINSEIWTAGSGTPIIGTNYGGFPIENTYYSSGTSWVVDPIIVTNTPTTVTPATSSSSGTTASSLIAIKTSAGTLYGIYLFNNSTTANTYLQVWNLGTGSITIGTTAPLYSFGVPYGGGAYIPFPEPIAMSTAITIAATTTRAGSTYATTGLDYDIIYV